MFERRIYPLLVALFGVFLFSAGCGVGGNNVCANGNCEGPDEDNGESMVMTCSSTEDCDGGYACEDGICLAVVDGCVNTNDCEFGLLCDTATSACVECLNDGQCSAGETCQEGVCADTVTPEDTGSTGSNSQPGSESSDSDTGSSNDSSASNGAECSGDGDCAYGRCDPGTGTCVDCLTDSDCPGGYVCDANVCVQSGDGGPGGGGDGGLGDLLGGGGPAACTAQADCDASCTVCNLDTQECESCSAVVECAGGLQCLDGASSGLPIGSFCVDDPNDFTAALACFGLGG